MDSHLTFYREESHLPRIVTWPLILGGAAVITAALGREIPDLSHSLLIPIVVGSALCAAFLLEFVGIVIEVRETEVRFSFVPFYRRAVAIADIRHWSNHTREVGGSGRSWRAPKHAVELKMADGSVLEFFTEHPQQLSNAIRDAKAKIPDQTP
jgi:hypothetical protein